MARGIWETTAWSTGTTFPPYCGEEYPSHLMAGQPVICDRDVHDDDERHHCSGLGFSWW